MHQGLNRTATISELKVVSPCFNLFHLNILTYYFVPRVPPVSTRLSNPGMSATRKGKRKRQNGNADLTQELALLIYASESEDSEKGEWGGGKEWEVEKITGEAIDMCGRRESVIYLCSFRSATDTPIDIE